MYENYPFWATFFRELGFRVMLSPLSDAHDLRAGHGVHPVRNPSAIPPSSPTGTSSGSSNHGIKTIFHPCVFYEHQEAPGAQNHFNCPDRRLVPGEHQEQRRGRRRTAGVRYHPSRSSPSRTRKPPPTGSSSSVATTGTFPSARRAMPPRPPRGTSSSSAKADVRAAGAKALADMEKNGGSGIVLAGRPYHVDPEINHGIPELIAAYGLTVLTEDCLPIDFTPKRPRAREWTSGSTTPASTPRRSSSAGATIWSSFSSTRSAAASTPSRPIEVCELLEQGGKLYTLPEDRRGQQPRRGAHPHPLAARRRWPCAREQPGAAIRRSAHTGRTSACGRIPRRCRRARYTILAPQMSPIHFDVLEPVFRRPRLPHGRGAATTTTAPPSTRASSTSTTTPAIPPSPSVGQLMDAVSLRRSTTRIGSPSS